jgi:hypothetical protein
VGTSVSGVSVIETGGKVPLLDTVVRYADTLGYDLTLTPKPTSPLPDYPPITPEQAAANWATLAAALGEGPAPLEGNE